MFNATYFYLRAGGGNATRGGGCACIFPLVLFQPLAQPLLLLRDPARQTLQAILIERIVSILQCILHVSCAITIVHYVRTYLAQFRNGPSWVSSQADQVIPHGLSGARFSRAPSRSQPSETRERFVAILILIRGPHGEPVYRATRSENSRTRSRSTNGT